MLHILLGQLPASAAQDLRRLNDHSGVFPLVGAQQGDGVGVSLVGKDLALKAVKLGLDGRKIRNGQCGARFGAAVPDDPGDALALLVQNTGAAGLDDPRLFGGDLFHRVPQNLGVVKADVHNDRDLRPGDDVCGVEPAAQTGLQHHDIAACLRIPQHGGGGHQLKFGGVVLHLLRRDTHPGDNVRQNFVSDLFPVDLHPLIEAVEIGGGKKPGFIASGLQHRGKHGGTAALAVGARNMDKLQPVLRVAQGVQQLRHPGKAGLGAEPGHAVNISKRFFVIHCI